MSEFNPIERLEPEPAAAERGRLARSPGQIPLRGWRDVLLRVLHESSRDNIALVAAGMAFYAMLSVAPALAVIISVYGLLVTPEALQSQMLVLGSYLPDDAAELIQDQLAELVNTRDQRLGWSLAASALVSLWSASRAMKGLFGGLNAVYDEVERRPWWKLTLESLVFTLGGILLLVLTLGTIAGIPVVLDLLPLSALNGLLLQLGSWTVVSAVVLSGLAIVYRFGPSRTPARWRWVSVGAVAAWLLWVVASAGFSWYVGQFDTYQRTYGALGAVAVLLMWFFVSSYAVLLGAELNAELEHQTSQDSTVGPDKPLGERGATMADQIGAVPGWRR